MADTTHALVYEEAVRAITQQQAVLDAVRARAAALLEAASVATAFLGGLAFTGRVLRGPLWIPLLVFVTVGVLSILVLLPVRGWQFSFDTRILISDYVEGKAPASLPEMHRDLALHLDNHYRSNNAILSRLFLLYRVASVLLLIEVVTWLYALGWG